MMMAVKELIDPQPVALPIVDAPWYVMLTEPQQDLPTVWRLHELGLELFVPVLRRRVKTGRIGKNGHKVTRVIAKPMFPGYGFLRAVGVTDYETVEDVRGVRNFMLDIHGEPVRLPHAAVIAVFRKQMQEHYEFLKQSQFKRGDAVRIDSDGGVYAGLIATVDEVDTKGRIHVLLGMIRHTLRADMVEAA